MKGKNNKKKIVIEKKEQGIKKENKRVRLIQGRAREGENTIKYTLAVKEDRKKQEQRENKGQRKEN